MEQSRSAKYWVKLDGKVECRLCPHNCKLSENAVGICRARKNVGGELHTLNYGLVSSVALDPIEKKPFYHFHPGTYILSVGTFGCNFKCSFCQNWEIAHDEPDLYAVTSEQLVEKAKELDNCIGLAFTYNEPSIWYEFVYDTCMISKEAGLNNVLVSNGFISEQPLRDLLPFVDAMNIDVKAFTGEYYKKICKGNLDDVKKTVEIAAKECHVEVTTLVLPGLNDAVEEIGELSRWLASIDKNIPLHLSRFFPNYKMTDLPPTPKETLMRAKGEAEKYLRWVHFGNV